MTRRQLPARRVGRLTPGSPAWHENRHRRIGGSEIAAVLGISPFESRFSLWHRKRGEIDPVEQTEVMLWGNLLEDIVARRFADLHPEYQVRRAPTYVHRHRSYQTAAPDRLLHHREGGIVLYEGKTSRVGEGFGRAGTDEIPVYYRAQCLWYLDCLGLELCHLAVLIGGSEYREYTIAYDEGEALTMRKAAAAFIDSLDDQTRRPHIDTHSATYQTVRELHPDIDGLAVEVPTHIAAGYLTAIEEERAAVAQKRGAAARLADAMGDAREAWSAGQKIALRVPGRDGAPPHLRPARTTNNVRKAAISA